MQWAELLGWPGLSSVRMSPAGLNGRMGGRRKFGRRRICPPVTAATSTLLSTGGWLEIVDQPGGVVGLPRLGGVLCGVLLV